MQHKIKKENIKHRKYIHKENIELLDKLVLHFMSRPNIDENTINLFEQDLIALTFDAQNNNQTLKDLIGDDVNGFTQEVYEAMDKPSKKYLFKYYKTWILSMLPILLVFEILSSIIDGNKFITINGHLIYMWISLIIFSWIFFSIYFNLKLSKSKKIIRITLFFIGLIAVPFLFKINSEIETLQFFTPLSFMETPLIKLSIASAILITLTFGLFLWLLKNYKINE